MKQFTLVKASGTNYEVVFDIPKKRAHIAHGQPLPESYESYPIEK